jgi:Ran GTPase-activating protein (RanGAP) involved in mRNA processing and transport
MPVPPWLLDNCNRLIANEATLTNLNLNIRRLSDADLELLADALEQNSNVRILNLTSSLSAPSRNRRLIDGCLQQILLHSTLEVIHLSYNRLGSFSATISNDPTSKLSELHLDHSSLDDLEPLFSSLRRNTSLKVLQLKSNRLCDNACHSLSDALVTNSSLEVLGLRRNLITSAGAARLEGCLGKSNMFLRRLELDENNGIPEHQLRRIETWCDANRLGRWRWQNDTSRPLLPYLWPIVMARMSERVDVVRLFLEIRRDVLLLSLSRGVGSRKRCR